MQVIFPDFHLEKLEMKLYVADGGLVRFHHSKGKVKILRTSRSSRALCFTESQNFWVSVVTSMYIADIFLKVISQLIDTSSFLILVLMMLSSIRWAISADVPGALQREYKAIEEMLEKKKQ